ncbi:uncharacterized protein ACOB8E_007156 isoform 2-T2 [Sarcophilus harrisii]
MFEGLQIGSLHLQNFRRQKRQKLQSHLLPGCLLRLLDKIKNNSLLQARKAFTTLFQLTFTNSLCNSLPPIPHERNDTKTVEETRKFWEEAHITDEETEENSIK